MMPVIVQCKARAKLERLLLRAFLVLSCCSGNPEGGIIDVLAFWLLNQTFPCIRLEPAGETIKVISHGGVSIFLLPKPSARHTHIALLRKWHLAGYSRWVFNVRGYDPQDHNWVRIKSPGKVAGCKWLDGVRASSPSTDGFKDCASYHHVERGGGTTCNPLL